MNSCLGRGWRLVKENELIRNARNGDYANFPEWIDLHSDKIIRFAFQYGLSLEEAKEVTLDTYITLRNKLKSLDEDTPLLLTLYKILLEKLSGYNPTLPIPEDVLPFKEDSLLHMKIVELNKRYRVPFILSFYHNFNNEQISIIIGDYTVDVQSNIQDVYEFLGDDRKSLELLKKSYNRLSVTFKAEQVFGSMEQPVIKSKKKSIRWTIIAAFAVVIILISLPLSFPNKEEKSGVNAITMESFIDLEEKYKTERAERQDQLKLEDVRFNQLNFIRTADEKMMKLKKSLDGGEIPKNVERNVENIIEELKLPSEMVVDIQREETLYDDETASIEHAIVYKEKIGDLITMYNGIIWDNRDTIEEFEGGAQKASSLMLSREELPSELQLAIDTMRNQSIQLCAKNNTFEINACYYKSTIHDQLSYLYHHSVSAYVGMMTYDYYLNNVNMVYSPGWISEELSGMQQAIIQTSKDEFYYKELESNFASFFYEVMKGNNLIKEMEVQGIVPTSYQQAWGTINYEEDTALPIRYLIQPIIEEMEASDWQKSESWDRLTRESLLDALKLAQEDKLEEIMFGKKPTLVSKKMELPNELFTAKIEKLYEEYRQTYDRTIFKELSPIYVVGVYDYANEMEDPTTMLNLLNFNNGEFHENEAGAEEWRADFMEFWQKGFSIIEEATSIEFSNENMERYGRNYSAYVNLGKEHSEDQYIPILIDKNGEYFLQSVVHTPLPSSVEMPEMDVSSIDKEWISHRYSYFTETKSFDEINYMTPIDIIATYFYAANRGDLETQYIFYYQGDGTKVIEKEQYFKKSNVNSPMQMEDLYKTISFKGLEQDENGNWPGIATLTVNKEMNPSKELIVEINMMWTKNGWRIVYPLK